MDNNMQDLVNAAKVKLKTQNKIEDQEEFTDPTEEQEDVYASMREEMENNEEELTYDIKTSVEDTQDDIQIQREPDSTDNYYIDPDDTPAFEDGPGLSQIDLWKKQFSKEKIYHTQILDKHFVFRTLNRFEYKQIVAYDNLDALRREELICQTCTLFPYNYNFKTMAAEDSGYPSTLAQIIMENSGFTKEYGIEIL